MQRQTSEAAWVDVSVFESVRDSFAISSADATAVYDQIAEALRRGEPVVLSFAGIKNVAAAFLMNAVGRLYGEFDEELIREKLRIEHAEGDVLVLLNCAVDHAKDFFRDPEAYNAAVSEMLDE